MRHQPILAVTFSSMAIVFGILSLTIQEPPTQPSTTNTASLQEPQCKGKSAPDPITFTISMLGAAFVGKVYAHLIELNNDDCN